jgi:cytochrome c556
MVLNKLIFTIVALLGVATTVSAAVKSEVAIEYRQGAFAMVGWNFMPLSQMVKGEVPWDAAEFGRRAERIAALAPQILEGFPADSESGPGVKTGTKPEVWKNMDDFKTKMDDFVAQSRALAGIAKANDEASMKEQFKKTAGACKACHDKYRNKE